MTLLERAADWCWDILSGLMPVVVFIFFLILLFWPYFTNRSVFYGDICMREKELRLMIRKEPTRIREHVDMVRVFKDAANTHEFPRRYR